MDDVGVDLLGDQRQAALLPGQPGRPVRDRSRPGDDARTRDQPAIPFFVSPLAGHRKVGARRFKGNHQPVDVAAKGAAVRRHGGRVD